MPFWHGGQPSKYRRPQGIHGSLDQVGEAEFANPITPVGAGLITIGQAVEIDAAFGVAPNTPSAISVGKAVEIETANAITPSGTLFVIIGQALENETGFAITPDGDTLINKALETEVARAIVPTAGAAPPPSCAVWTNPLTYDWDNCVGLSRAVHTLPVTYGTIDITPAYAAANAISGNGTVGNEWIVDGGHIRLDPALNVRGDPRGCVPAYLRVSASNLIVRNFRAPAYWHNTAISNVRFENCHFDLYDYRDNTGTAPPSNTIDDLLNPGHPVSASTKRQYYWQQKTRTAYIIDPPRGVTSWVYAGETWANLSATQPTSPVTGAAWVKLDAGGALFIDKTTPTPYVRYNGSSYVDITPTVYPDVVWANDGQNRCGFDCGSVSDGVRFLRTRMAGIEDTLFHNGSNPAFILQYCDILNNNHCRARKNPHGDGIQTTNGARYRIERSRVMMGGWFNLGVSDPTKGAPYSSAVLFKCDFGDISDLKCSEVLWYLHGNGIQLITAINGHNTTDMRIRNSVFMGKTKFVSAGSGAKLMTTCRTISGTTVCLTPSELSWSSNIWGDDGTTIVPGTYGVPAGALTSDPTGEGTALTP